jgi:acyl-coenzyme A thioesterase PaaI-like protein
MTHCLFHNGIEAVTGDLEVRFLRPVPCNARVDLRARIERPSPPLYKVYSELTCDRRLMARATGRFMDLPEED